MGPTVIASPASPRKERWQLNWGRCWTLIGCGTTSNFRPADLYHQNHRTGIINLTITGQIQCILLLFPNSDSVVSDYTESTKILECLILSIPILIQLLILILLENTCAVIALAPLSISNDIHTHEQADHPV